MSLISETGFKKCTYKKVLQRKIVLINLHIEKIIQVKYINSLCSFEHCEL
jgi:hypothetical protein